jgi:hypothetical protein
MTIRLGELRTAFETLERGKELTYYRGYLVKDRRETTPSRPHDPYFVNKAGKMAHDFMKQGRVALVQRRHGHEDYEYIAQRAV